MNFQARSVEGPLSRVKTPPSTGYSYLLSDRTVERYRRAVAEGVERVAERLNQVDRPFTGVSPAQLESVIAGIDLDEPVRDVAAALDEVGRIYLRDAVYFHHPRYLGHLNCPVVIPALLAEAMLSSVNSSLDTWDQSIGATLIERRLIDWAAGRIGLGGAADGVFTSGGTQSNLQALLVAREEASRRAVDSDRMTSGSSLRPRLRVVASEASHFSIAKSAKLLGLAEDAVIEVPSDRDKRMRIAALADELDRCHRDGLVPMAVVATAGTTDFGSIDPLPEIAEVCAQRKVWMHVDAAYGCGLLVSRRRHLLDGLERADSVTVDYHKSFFQPVSSSAVMVRDRTTLGHVTYHADYLNPATSLASSIPNQVDKSLQTTRRFDALKLWVTLRILGPDVVGELFDEVVDRAADAWALLDEDPRFEVVTRPQLSTLVFRYLPPAGTSPDLADRVNAHVREELFASGEAVVAGTKVHGRRYLKFTLLNPRTSLHDVTDVLELIAARAARFLSRLDHVDLPDSRAG
ncbi:MAG: pyridoxal phosphate-dependent decarboxylase family protein [Streptosporangiaceae bacterium]